MIFNKKANRIKELEVDYAALQKKYAEARDFKVILTKLADKAGTTVSMAYVDDLVGSGGHIPDDVARYVEDLFGGKVIEQEANKAILIGKDGSIKTGHTRKACDKGREYKLVQD